MLRGSKKIRESEKFTHCSVGSTSNFLKPVNIFFLLHIKFILFSSEYLLALDRAGLTHFTVHCFIVIFTNWRFVLTLCWANLLMPFPNSICSLCVSASHFSNSYNVSHFLTLLSLFWWSMIFDVRIVIIIALKK